MSSECHICPHQTIDPKLKQDVVTSHSIKRARSRKAILSLEPGYPSPSPKTASSPVSYPDDGELVSRAGPVEDSHPSDDGLQLLRRHVLNMVTYSPDRPHHDHTRVSKPPAHARQIGRLAVEPGTRSARVKVRSL